MNDRDMLWRAMLANQADETARCAYADYLQEHDPTHTADLIAGNPYIPASVRPWPQQLRFLDAQGVRAGFVSGRLGGGKTTALLMAALMHVEYPGYHAAVFAHSRAAIDQPGGFRDTLRRWAPDCSRVRDGNGVLFPSGATVVFVLGTSPVTFLSGRELSFVGIDNADLYSLSQLETLVSAVRPPKRPQVPFRLRLTGATQMVMPVGTVVIDGTPTNPHLLPEAAGT